MTTRNRGKEASDDRLFAEQKMQKALRLAAADMSYLLSRGFAERSSLQLVGNRYRLNVRQQKALQGISASTQQVLLRADKSVTPILVCKRNIAIDGFNLLILLESALSGAYIFKGLDGYYRDLSGVHGTYKRVTKTEEAIVLVGSVLQELGVSSAIWYFDTPVSNSGSIKTKIREIVEEHQYPWTIHLVDNPDTVLAESSDVVVSSDAWVLDRAKENFNLAHYIFENHIKKTSIFLV